MARRMKVFTWSDGFHAYTLAAPSRTKSLEAWGLARDIFKSGEAKEITSGEDCRAALDRPGETIKRDLHVDLGKSVSLGRAKPAPAKPRKADLARVETLEGELASLDGEHVKQVASIEAEERALAAKAERLEAAFAAKRKGLSERLAAAKAKVS